MIVDCHTSTENRLPCRIEEEWAEPLAAILRRRERQLEHDFPETPGMVTGEATTENAARGKQEALCVMPDRS